MISLAGLTLAAAAICGAYLLAFLPDPLPRAAPWLLWGGLCLVLPSFLGLALEGSKGRAARVAVVLLLFAVPAAGLGGALLLPVEDPDSPLILGLPARAALLLYGVGLVPGLCCRWPMP